MSQTSFNIDGLKIAVSRWGIRREVPLMFNLLKWNWSKSSFLISSRAHRLVEMVIRIILTGAPYSGNRIECKTAQLLKFLFAFALIIFPFQPLNQLVTSGNANLYSNNAIEEGLHSALGIQADNSQPV